MLQTVKQKIRQKIGPAAAPRPDTGTMAVRDRWADLRRLTTAAAPVIVDGGANCGDTVAEFLRYFPKASVTAFEPQPDRAAGLVRRFEGDARVRTIAKALGAEAGPVNLQVTGFDAASSILSPSDVGRSIHGQKLDVVRSVDVPQVRLDTELDTAGVTGTIDILKLDLQGYEVQALRGAAAALARIKLILTEVQFTALYDGAATIGDLDLLMRSAGFELLNLYDLYTQPGGRLSSGDAIYFNTRFYNAQPSGGVSPI